MEPRLYVAGDFPKSRTALANLQRLCESYLNGNDHIGVVASGSPMRIRSSP